MEMAPTDAELAKDEEYAKGVAAILKNVPALQAGVISGDPVSIQDGHRRRPGWLSYAGARTGNGTPRKVKSSDAERSSSRTSSTPP